MNYKEEIIKVLNRLSEKGIDRAMIEKDFEYADNFIDQTLSRGGNKKFLAAIKIYEKAVLQNATPLSQIKKDEKVSLETIQRDLDNILHHQVWTRAEVRAYGQYPISRDAEGDREQVAKILEEIGRLAAAHAGSIARERI